MNSSNVVITLALVALAVSCGVLETKTDSAIKTIEHSYTAEPSSEDADLWNVQCLDRTFEVRTTNEIQRNNVCEPGPKLVTKQKTILTARMWVSGEGYVTRNCVLPKGATLKVHRVSNVDMQSGQRFQIELATISSAIAKECREMISNNYLDYATGFSDHFVFRKFDSSIYNPSYPSYPN